MVEDKFSNRFVAKILRQMAAAHEAKGENTFTVRAYENAADSAEHATASLRDLWEEGKLSEVPGFGKSISGYLNEYFKNGKVKHFERLKKGLPSGMFEVLGLPRIGSKTAYKLAKLLKLRAGSAIEDLEKYCRDGRVGRLEGFGDQSEKEILKGILESKGKGESRLLLSQAYPLSDSILSYLRKCPDVQKADPLGSLRRFVATVGDVDISVSSRNKALVIKHFLKFPNIKDVLWAGENKATVILKNGQQVDVMVESPSSYGSLLQHFTGSKSHNIRLREFALRKGLSLSEHGIKKLAGRGKWQMIKFGDEKSFYNFLGLEWIPPELREDEGEIQAAVEGKIPQLIELKDVKGDLQTHTVWSDGESRVEEMAAAAQKIGYSYLGITDHQLSFEKLGEKKIKSEIIRRKNHIEQINYANKKIRVLNGIELLIKASGELSYPNSLLELFDYVMVAVHTGFNLGRQDNTKRLINALKNPWVKILAHPTGRQLGYREGIEADWVEIFKICAAEKKFLEIDGTPERLDLPDLMVKQAKALGVKFVIDTDAHATVTFNNMLYGVAVARRGWLTKEDVINTLSFAKLKEVLRIKK